jgi:hypothetical protein
VTGGQIVAVVLVVGGVVYLATFLWITVVRVREEYSKMWPPEGGEHRSEH